jgi:hypothetical protein
MVINFCFLPGYLALKLLVSNYIYTMKKGSEQTDPLLLILRLKSTTFIFIKANPSYRK